MMRRFPKGHNQKKRFLPLTRAWEMQTGALPFYKREKATMRKRCTGLAQTSPKSGSAEVICFNSRNSLLSGHQTLGRSSQDLVLSLVRSHESKSLCLSTKGWLAVPDKSLPSEAEESFWKGLFQLTKPPGYKM